MSSGPAVPVVLGQRVLDRDERVRGDQLGVVRVHLGRGAVLALEAVDAVLEELGRGDVEAERDVGAEREAGLADRLGDEVERRAVVLEVGGEAALVAEAGRQPLRLQQALQRVVGLDAPAEGLGTSARRSAGS